MNHLGHFLLTNLLIEKLISTPEARIINVSSEAQRQGHIDFEDLMQEKGKYSGMRAYSQAKLANILFAYELQRRFEVAGIDAIAVAAHPGGTATNLQRYNRMHRLMKVLAQNPEMGALPTLYAATAPDVRGGDYYGPRSWFGWRGYPAKVESSDLSNDMDIAAKLWTISEELTRVKYYLFTKV